MSVLYDPETLFVTSRAAHRLCVLRALLMLRTAMCNFYSLPTDDSSKVISNVSTKSSKGINSGHKFWNSVRGLELHIPNGI